MSVLGNPLTSGMNPPCNTPRMALVARKEDLPESQNCEQATMLHMDNCMGIHRSGPTHFDTSCDGSSDNRNASLNTDCPRL